MNTKFKKLAFTLTKSIGSQSKIYKLITLNCNTKNYVLINFHRKNFTNKGIDLKIFSGNENLQNFILTTKKDIENNSFDYEKYLNGLLIIEQELNESGNHGAAISELGELLIEFTNIIKNIIPKEVNQFLVKITMQLSISVGIKSEELNKILFQIAKENANFFNTQIKLECLKLNEISGKKLPFNEIFYESFKKEYENYTYNELMNSFIFYIFNMKEQSFVNKLQTQLLIYESNISANFSHLGILFNRATHNPKINLNILFERLLELLTKNINCLKSEDQIKFLSSYAYYLTQASERNSLDKQIYKNIIKLFSYSEKELILSITDLKIELCVELLNTFFITGQGSVEFFEQIEKYLGKNIDTIDSNQLIIILNCFVLSGKYRPKFLILMQKRISDIKEQFHPKELSKILRIFSSLKTNHEYIYDKCHDYLNSHLSQCDLEDLANLTFGYSNPNLKSKYLILNDIEDHLYKRLKNIRLTAENDIECIADILSSYVYLKKGEKNFLDLLVKLIIDSGISEINSQILFKIFYVFSQLKLNRQYTEIYEDQLKERLINYNKEELVRLLGFFRDLTYANPEILDLLDKCVKIEMNDDILEKNEEKLKIFKEHKIQPKMDQKLKFFEYSIKSKD